MSFLRDVQKSSEVMDPELKGKFFENFVASELKKKFINTGHLTETLYFWQTEKNDNEDSYEVDFIINRAITPIAIEVKSRDTIRPDDFKNMNKFSKLTKLKRFLIYTGPTTETEFGLALNWMDCERLIQV
jgi:predicted AAA+ superfamily ATPase